jgi:hypothetical protein
MGVGTMRTINKRAILRIIQKMNDQLSSFMRNQATPHFGSHSYLMNNESSNHRGQPRIGTALTVKWIANILISQ